MAETTQIMFSHKEVVASLLKQQGIHEGIWMLALTFGMGAANVGQNEDGSDINPAAIVPVINIGILKTDKINNMSVDASEANPA